MEAVRIASYNVHSCIGNDGRCAPERIAEVLAEMDCDIACLQELDCERARSSGADQAAEIARRLTMHFHFNPTVIQASERYGDAILSKTPFTIVAAGALPAVPRPLLREPRGVIWITTELAGRRWQILNTHLGLGHRERRLQAQALIDGWVAPALVHPAVVVCGDLNSRPASTVHRILHPVLRDVFRTAGLPHPRTFSTRWPLLCLDFVYASPTVHARNAQRWTSPLSAIASDHFPILAELEAPAQPSAPERFAELSHG